VSTFPKPAGYLALSTERIVASEGPRLINYPFATLANPRGTALGKTQPRKALCAAGGFGSLVVFPTITTMFFAAWLIMAVLWYITNTSTLLYFRF
jgi:hypothetical protein